jgi:hypothetical protein
MPPLKSVHKLQEVLKTRVLKESARNYARWATWKKSKELNGCRYLDSAPLKKDTDVEEDTVEAIVLE